MYFLQDTYIVKFLTVIPYYVNVSPPSKFQTVIRKSAECLNNIVFTSINQIYNKKSLNYFPLYLPLSPFHPPPYFPLFPSYSTFLFISPFFLNVSPPYLPLFSPYFPPLPFFLSYPFSLFSLLLLLFLYFPSSLHFPLLPQCFPSFIILYSYINFLTFPYFTQFFSLTF